MKTIKRGLSTARKMPDRPMDMRPDRVLEPHHVRHPNDKNIPRKDKGINWAKKGAKKTEREKRLEQFYKTHVYTWVSENRRAWVAIPSEEEE